MFGAEITADTCADKIEAIIELDNDLLYSASAAVFFPRQGERDVWGARRNALSVCEPASFHSLSSFKTSKHTGISKWIYPSKWFSTGKPQENVAL